MAVKIKIVIPEPCHENWQDMTVADKGRFCASCQKTVVDFTGLTDHEATHILKADKNTCGRFLETQLNRELTAPEAKNSLWIAAGVAAISFLGLGTTTATAQGKPYIEQAPAKTAVPDASPQYPAPPAGTKTYSGTVVNKAGKPIKGVTVTIKNSLTTTITDAAGKFTIEAAPGDILHFAAYDIIGQNIPIKKQTPAKLTVTLHPVRHVMGSPRYF